MRENKQIQKLDYKLKRSGEKLNLNLKKKRENLN